MARAENAEPKDWLHLIGRVSVFVLVGYSRSCAEHFSLQNRRISGEVSETVSL